jgi:hypothetical protein
VRWVEESERINLRPFKPFSKERSLQYPGRTNLVNILEELKTVLIEDWNEINFIIGTNPDEMIEIKFDQQTQDIEKGL